MKLNLLISMILAPFASVSIAYASPCLDETHASKDGGMAGHKASNRTILSSEISVEAVLPDPQPNIRQSKRRIYEITLTVIDVVKQSPFLVNVCRTKGCTDPSLNMISSFSFFPPPKVGQTENFLIEIPDVRQLEKWKTVYFLIEKIDKNADGKILIELENIKEIIE